MDGKLIVIDGIDSVGKQTQKEMMREYLIKYRHLEEDKDFAVIDFPRYNEFSSEFVRAYLGGKLTSNPNDIDPYLASTFYSIDRSLSFKNEKWGEVYRNGGLIIADRYTCSNVIYQGSKLMQIKNFAGVSVRNKDKFELYKFAKWLYGFELNDLDLPKPDAIVYLMLDEKANQKLLDKRAETEGKDIHEANNDFLNRCRYTLGVYKELMENRFAVEASGLGLILEKCNNIFLDITDPKTGEIMDRDTIHKKIINEVFDFNPYITAPKIPWIKQAKEN